MGEIRWTLEAAEWLEHIHTFIAQDEQDAADRTIREIYSKSVRLNQFPRSGRLYRQVTEGEVRYILHEHYRITYLLDRDGGIVMLGVFHGALDIDRYL